MGYLNEDGLATLVGKVKGQVVQLTQAEYMQIPDSEKNFNNKIYFVEDEEFSWKIDDEPTLNSDGLAKSGGIYTYTSKIGSGTLTTTAQTIVPAINELDAAIDVLRSSLLTIKDVNVPLGTIGGNTIATVDYDVSGNPATFGFVVGFMIQNSGEVVPLRVRMSNKNTISLRVRNLSSNQITGATLYVAYV